MKRKTKRLGRKKWVAFLAPLRAILAFVALLYNILKESTIPILISLIKSWFLLDNKSNLPYPILFCISIATIALLSLIISRLYLNYNKPNRKYFEIIDFKKPTDDVIKNAAEGILNSEKTQPYFVHAAPVNDEIEEFIFARGRCYHRSTKSSSNRVNKIVSFARSCWRPARCGRPQEFL